MTSEIEPEDAAIKQELNSRYADDPVAMMEFTWGILSAYRKAAKDAYAVLSERQRTAVLANLNLAVASIPERKKPRKEGFAYALLRLQA